MTVGGSFRRTTTASSTAGNSASDTASDTTPKSVTRMVQLRGRAGMRRLRGYQSTIAPSAAVPATAPAPRPPTS
jgi:hypothetical protein